MSHHFPFAAIVGQEKLKTALLLCAIDRKIGGLLISGPRGSAKSTLVRALGEVDPCARICNVPLGSSEEMITGSFDLEKALSESQYVFKGGILEKADEGVLYVDEVNLLADHLVDLLLDTAASGVNHIERDGISHSHASRFALIGTMNPAEGDLRPQLLDRFGMMCEVQTRFSAQQRQEIVARRIAFDHDRVAFLALWNERNCALKQAIEAAKNLLMEVQLNDSMAAAIAQCCEEACVEGFRADIALHRACKSHAALHRRTDVIDEDLAAVQELVLRHRRKPADNSTNNSSSGNSESGNLPPANEPSNNQTSAQTSTQSSTQYSEHSGSSIQGSWGSQQLTPTFTAHLKMAVSTQTNAHNRTRNHKPKSIHAATAVNEKVTREKGWQPSPRYAAKSSISNQKINWYQTLGTVKNFNKMYSQEKFRRLKFKYSQPRGCGLDLVLLDVSASVLEGGGINQARGFIKALAERCYQKRRKLGVYSFGNQKVECLIYPQKPAGDIDRYLDKIRAGGGTPMGVALDYLQALFDKNAAKQDATASCAVFLLTDGRVDQSISQHRLFKQYHIHIIDTEFANVPLGRARNLATLSGADYSKLSELSLQ